MHTVSIAEALREQLRDWRGTGDHIALVPTMGNLHEGHLSLVALAREHAERVVVSIFVNPTQFDDPDDFERYPRTLALDERKLKKANADLLFLPDLETMYPFGIDNATSVTVPVLSEELCGEFRPGHFDGVTSVVSRLFSIVQPDVAVFGEKDYQQLLIVKRLVADLSLEIEIASGPVVRESDGLAMSSRNQYLSEEERAVAPGLYAVLEDTAEQLQSGNRDFEALEKQAVEVLRSQGFEPEYVSIRRAENLGLPDRDDDRLVVLAAARLGGTRLIDNVQIGI
ncbi:MAG: pantoate--beta-alanine ligase [Steroidobacteraceae bacterium]